MEVEQLLDARGRTHGDFNKTAAISQELKAVVYGNLVSNPSPSQREAIEMILLKIARIVSGDSKFIDHWKDITGYAELGANELRGK
jgi:hypothetical protein